LQVNLSWGAVPNALYYKVYRSTFSGGPYQLVGQSNPNPGMTSASTNILTTYQDGPGNLSNGVNYFYVISTVTTDGESAYGTEIAAIWPGAPTAPTGGTVVVT
jgi:hypothetical protein